MKGNRVNLSPRTSRYLGPAYRSMQTGRDLGPACTSWGHHLAFGGGESDAVTAPVLRAPDRRLTLSLAAGLGCVKSKRWKSKNLRPMNDSKNGLKDKQLKCSKCLLKSISKLLYALFAVVLEVSLGLWPCQESTLLACHILNPWVILNAPLCARYTERGLFL